VLAEIVKWVAIAVLLIGVTITIHALFPPIRGHLAIGVAAGLLLFVMYGVQYLRD
jgi:cytochrome bd-type quinol oxidase subunit 1